MANAEQIKALIKSHAEGDDERFFAVAMQMAAGAARRGHGQLARQLRDLIDTAKSTRKAQPAGDRRPVPVVQPRGELAGLLAVSYPKTRLSDMVLEDVSRQRLERVLIEHRQQGRFKEYGLCPRRKLLLIGPPGTGKTMTGNALAGEMKLPLFKILLDGLITKYMGETAAKLRLVFDAIEKTRAVYLFDEFDALGGKRISPNDVGEIRRVLNSFLQFLEQDESDSVIIAATNHPELLDRALFRRFEDVIEYRLPNEELAIKAIRAHLSLLDLKGVDWPAVAAHLEGLSYAELVRACEDAAKETLLDDETRVTTQRLEESLKSRQATRSLSDPATR